MEVRAKFKKGKHYSYYQLAKLSTSKNLLSLNAITVFVMIYTDIILDSAKVIFLMLIIVQKQKKIATNEYHTNSANKEIIQK